MSIFTHICLGTNDLPRARRFYDAALVPLGIRNLGDFGDQGIAYGHALAELLILRPLDGAPGPRGAVEHAFGAYLRDPDGNKICAYCFGAND